MKIQISLFPKEKKVILDFGLAWSFDKFMYMDILIWLQPKTFVTFASAPEKQGLQT